MAGWDNFNKIIFLTNYVPLKQNGKFQHNILKHFNMSKKYKFDNNQNENLC